MKAARRNGARSRIAIVLAALMLLSSLFAAVPAAVNAAEGDANLVVTNITWTPENPQPGEEVTFSATVKNIGTDASRNAIVGVRFDIGQLGSYVSWSDNTTASIPAGGELTVTANGGPNNKATWTAGAKGTTQVIAWVDDQNRIPESNTGDNQLTKSLEIGKEVVVPSEPCDLAISELRAEIGTLYKNDQTKLVAFVKNESENAAGAFKVSYSVDGRTVDTVTYTGGIAAGGTAVVVSGQKWTSAFGTHTLRAEVNPDSTLPETNTDNNKRLGLIKVKDETRPSLGPMDIGNDGLEYYIQSLANDKLLSAGSTGNSPIAAEGAGTVLDEEAYRIIWNEDGTVSLQCVKNGKYLSAVLEDGNYLMARGDSVGENERFLPEKLEEGVYALRAAGGNYLSVDANADRVVYASVPSVSGNGQKFRFGLRSEYEDPLTGIERSKQEVLSYLHGISGVSTIAGQHNREPNSDPAKWTNTIAGLTGKTPGMWSGDFLYLPDDIRNRWTMIYEAERQWNSGALVNIMWHAAPPDQGEPCEWEGGIKSHLSDDQWNDLITEGGYLNGVWKSRMDEIAVYLQYLQEKGVVTMFRPLHEMNQGVFWWGGRTGENGTAKLYEITHDYLENQKGLKNLIWVWDVQDLSYNFNDYRPDDSAWDIMALDVYNPDGVTQYKYQKMLETAGNKLIAIGECQKLPTPEQLAQMPRWVFFMGWAELVTENNSSDEITALYGSSRVITLDRMPGWTGR